MNDFKKIQDSLRAKKYEPLSKLELNSLALSNENPEKVINSCQRLIIRSMSSFLNFKQFDDETLCELFHVANISIYESMLQYKYEKIDFAYFAFCSVKNAILNHFKFKTYIIKPSIIKYELKSASYLYLDEYYEDVDGKYFEISIEEDLFEYKIDLNYIREELKKGKYPSSDEQIDFYFDFMGFFDYAKTKAEISKKYNVSYQCTMERVELMKKKIMDRPKILNYLKKISINFWFLIFYAYLYKKSKMNFKNLKTTKLGETAERIGAEFIQKKGYSVYSPYFSNISHEVDFVAMSGSSEFNLDVKCKSSMSYHPATGFDLKDFEKYKQLKKHTYILFVDIKEKKIYGNWLYILANDVYQVFDGKKEKTITFPLSAMTEYRQMTEFEYNELKQMEQSNYN